jgi:hypothetical protein
MSRIINTDSPGKIRSQLKRTCAELLRHLSQKQTVDNEAKDMAALLTRCLHRIEQGIEESASVWEKRDCWFWVGQFAGRLERVIRSGTWTDLPELLMRLLPYFADVKVTRLTRSSKAWEGAYERFLSGTLDG